MKGVRVNRRLLLVSVSLLWVLVLVGACMPIQPVTQVSAQPAAEDIEAAVNAIWREYESSLLAGDADRWLALWADEGVQMPPDEPLVNGKDAIEAGIRGGLDSVEYTAFAINNLEAHAANGWAFARGLYTGTYVAKAGGTPVNIDGKYMTIFQKQSDGTWKLYRDIFNSNVAPGMLQAEEAAPSAEEDIEAAVNTIWREYESALLAGDADRWLALWANEGVQMPPDASLVDGKDAIEARIRGGLGKVQYTAFAINNLEAQAADGWAFARGLYTGTYVAKAGGTPVNIDGKYMTIFQKQSDGTWKLYRDIFNSNVAPGMLQAENAKLSAELHARFSANDLEGALALADDDMELVAYALGLDLKGKDKFMGFMTARKTAFPDLSIEHINVVASGDQVVVEFVATGTHTGPLNTPTGVIEATGAAVTLHVVEVHTWRDGKLVRLVNYQDLASTLRQIGVME